MNAAALNEAYRLGVLAGCEGRHGDQKKDLAELLKRLKLDVAAKEKAARAKGLRSRTRGET